MSEVQNSLPTVSIGIPAYNEEANIKKLLTSLLQQKQGSFVLEKIIVVSDGSSDNTVTEANSINDPRVIVVDSKERKGQAARQNEILEMFEGDILVLLNADMLPRDLYLENMVEPFSKIENLGLVSNRVVPLDAVTFIEKVINFSIRLKFRMLEGWRGGDNIYMCRGASRAFSKELASELRFGETVAEDAFSYLFNKSKGYKFFYSKEAIVNYRSPQTLTDHKKQSVRFMNTRGDLQRFFPQIEVSKEYDFPKYLLFREVFLGLIYHPILMISYLLIQVYIFLTGRNIKVSTVWETSATSKNL